MKRVDFGDYGLDVFEAGDGVTVFDRHARGERGTVAAALFGPGGVWYRVRIGGRERTVGPAYVRADDYCDFFPETL